MIAGFLFLLSACGGGTNQPPTISIIVSPASVSLNGGASQQFTASVQGTSNQAVTWTISAPGCSGAACGTVTADGLYTAPTPVGAAVSVSIIATSVADSTKTGRAAASLVPVSVTISPGSISLNAGASQQFAASVQGTTNQAVTWTMSAPGCSGATCGTLSPDGLYTAPTPVGAAVSVSIIATSVADSTKTGLAAASLVPVSVTISPATTSVYQRDMTRFTVLVGGTSNQSVVWTINGMIGGSCSTGYILPSGTYTTAYCDIFNPPQAFTITATSQADNTKSGSAQVTVTGLAPNNSKLNGDYAFLFQGFDLDGPVGLAGRITADGAGGLYAGVLGVNRVSSTLLMSASGNYSIGSDNRGTMLLGNYLVRFVMDSSGGLRFVDVDETMNNPIRGAGIMKPQNPAAFSLNAFNGDFAMELTGAMNSAPIALIGRFTSDTTGSLTSGTADAVVPASHAGNLTLTGTFGTTLPDFITGQGLATLNLGGGSPIANPMSIAYFIVSGSEAFGVSLDPRSATVPLLSGAILKQQGRPFSNGSLNSSTILQLRGIDPASGGSHVILGQAAFDGASNVAGITDENRAGSIDSSVTFTGSYLVAANGRGTGTRSMAGGSGTSFTFYLVSSNTAFIVGGTPGASSGEVVTGTLEPQTGSPFSTSSIAGTYRFGTLPPATSAVSTVVGSYMVAASNSFQGVLDGCTSSSCFLNVAATGSYTLLDPNIGHGTINLQGVTIPYLVASPSKILLLRSGQPSDTGAAIEVLEE